MKLDPQKVREIRGQLHLGKKSEWLACKYGVTNSTIQRIKYKLSWKEVRVGIPR